MLARHAFALLTVAAVAMTACGRTALTGNERGDSGPAPQCMRDVGVACGRSLADCGDLEVVAYWPFEEGQGQIIHDVVGGNDGSLQSATLRAAWVPGQVDFAYHFGGWVGSYAPFDSSDESGDFIIAGRSPRPPSSRARGEPRLQALRSPHYWAEGDPRARVRPP